MKRNLIESFIKAVKEMSQDKEGGCCYWILDADNNGNNWAIIIGWQDGFEEDAEDKLSDGTWHLCTKVAYQPHNSLMQCDYMIDWEMPYNEESGDIWDTDIAVYLNDNHEETVKWLLDQFEEMKKVLPCWKTEVA